ncbi:MAG: hypothetical protein ABIW03_03580 [Sphingomicrobium sp.]
MRIQIVSLLLILSGCAPVPMSAPTAHAPACASMVFPTNPQIGAGSVDKFAGAYASGTRSLTVRREGSRLLVQDGTQAPREITTSDLNSWEFHDGCGISYRFVLPPDGPGAMLTILAPGASATQWHRTGY